jgi:membrane associated rhomboid family serine protease
VTKAILISVVSTTLFASIAGTHSKLSLNALSVLQHGEAWRLVTHNFLFATPGELLFGVVLLYFLRQFERQMGSSRFFAFAMLSASFYTTELFLLDLAIGRRVVLSSGPYPFIFASMVRFFFETPKIYEFQLFGNLSLSDKSFPYLLAVQLVFSSIPQSLICLGCGIVGGLVLRLPVLQPYIQTPTPLVSLASTTILPLMDTAPANSTRARRLSHPRRGRTVAQGQEQRSSHHLEDSAPTSTLSAPRQSSDRQASGVALSTEANVGPSTTVGYVRE